MPKQTTDVDGAPYGIEFDGPDQKWAVAKGVTVSGTYGAVFSDEASSTLVNRGLLTSDGYGASFMFDGGSATIVNTAAGVIDAYRAILMIGNDLTVTFRNGGVIEGGEYAISVMGGMSGTFKNKGTIAADITAVEINTYTGSVGTFFENSGRIVGAANGIIVAALDNAVFEILNDDEGIIKGGDYGVVVGEQLVLTNFGKIGGAVISGNHNDKIVNHNKIKGDVWLGGGADHFVNKGKAKAGLVDGGDGLNVVVMGFRADKLLFDSALGDANRTSIRKFESGEDKLFLDEDRFAALTPGKLLESEFHKGTRAADADDHIIYDQKSGTIYYDPDGAGGVSQIAFGFLEKGTKLAAADFKVGEYSILDA